MKVTTKAVGLLLIMGVALGSSNAMADGSLKDTPAAASDAREFKFSWNAGLASNYIFRGVSQSADRASANGGIDLTYGIAYAGIALSTINFGKDNLFGPTPGKDIARVESDFYAGIKPVVGPVTFDLGVIAYTYPSAVYGLSAGHTYDNPTYVEGKLGASGDIYKGGTIGATLFYSPEYQFKAGKVTTLEGTFAHAFKEMNGITPTFSALIGMQWGSNNASYLVNFGNGDSSYKYWNAGMTFAVDKWSLDLRYWDSDLKHNAGGSTFCTASTFQCGSKFMGAIKYTY